MVFFSENGPPKDQKERLIVVKKMRDIVERVQHVGGDRNICQGLDEKGIRLSILIALTDGNLNQYGISPQELAQLVKSGNGWSSRELAKVKFCQCS